MGQPTTVRQFMIAALIFTAVLTGTFFMISSFVPENSGNFSDYNRSLNKFNDIKNNANSMTSSIEDAEPDEGVEGILSGLYSTSFGTVKQMWTSANTIKVITEDLSEGATPIGLPTWLTGLFWGLISTAIIFAIIASWRKWHT